MSPTEERRAAKPPANWLGRISLIALIGYWLTLFTATHARIDPNLIVHGNDKTLHLVGYTGLGLLFGLALGTSAFARRFHFLGALVFLAIYAVFDELTQLLVGRHCDLYDWFADCAGIFIGLTAASAILRTLPARSASKGA